MTRLTDISSIHWQPALNQPDVVEAEADISQSIRVILTTPKGSVPHRPQFGSNLHRYLDQPIDRALPQLVRETTEAIRDWEPRCTLIKVLPVAEGATMRIKVWWKLADGIQHETEVRL
ncbi:hypothetical protein HNQ59_000687 [Chitinivorax tropicus]|uniref:IraD/Gp25-like domain-containing protein n=1 Tax=Chitinivorax tropicus TaxID=714531 RepID=A0A840MMJ4_9PROT|nr:GPW/gp25 family protein [Chitinivorax tropicus]MBB5017423.1 hypothetical protein [Chitinivorax tropicus]